MASPVMASSSATAMGRRLGMRMRPPAPAMRPRLASGMPKVAWSAATTRSHESMISKPPARADPLTAAMIGLGKSRWVSPPKPPLAPMMSPPSPLLKALRSMPALKALSPLPVITTTQHSASSVSSSMTPDMAVLTAPLMALRASGRLMVRISTCPRRSRSTSSAMVLPSLRAPPSAGAERRRGYRTGVAGADPGQAEGRAPDVAVTPGGRPVAPSGPAACGIGRARRAEARHQGADPICVRFV